MTLRRICAFGFSIYERGRGVTLVELALTIGLAGILGIPTGLLVSEHLRLAMSSQDSVVAMQLARARMEQLDALNDFFALEPAQDAQDATLNSQAGPYEVAISVRCQAGDCTRNMSRQGMKRVEVTVTRAGSPQPLARLVSFRTKQVFFGS